MLPESAASKNRRPNMTSPPKAKVTVPGASRASLTTLPSPSARTRVREIKPGALTVAQVAGPSSPNAP